MRKCGGGMVYQLAPKPSMDITMAWRAEVGACPWGSAARENATELTAATKARKRTDRAKELLPLRIACRTMGLPVMSTATSPSGVLPVNATRPVVRFATALEILLVYAGILLYIWRWQFSYPRTWMILLAVVLASHVVHRDTLRDMGLTWHGLRASAGLVLPLAAALFVPLVVYGFARGTLVLLGPNRKTAASLALYAFWCLFQQYLMQSYFHRRLMALVRNPHRSSLIMALMFGAAHIPNPVLMVATTLGGFLLAEVFARHRNIWPLALAQAVGGYLVAALTPVHIIRNMRVGPGYYFFGLK